MCGSTSGVRLALLALVACACLEACSAAAAAAGATGPDGRPYTRGAAGAVTYCGSRLADALKFMCNGHYNSYFKVRRTTPVERSVSVSDESQSPPQAAAKDNVALRTPSEQLPFRERLRAAAFLESRTRTRFTRGVYDECCSKSCTLDELMAYCELRN